MKSSSGTPAAAAASLRLSSDGPIVPCADGIALKVWQAPQPFSVKVASPVARRRRRRGLPDSSRQVSNSAWVITIAWLRMSEWPRPQSSVQITG